MPHLLFPLICRIFDYFIYFAGKTLTTMKHKFYLCLLLGGMLYTRHMRLHKDSKLQPSGYFQNQGIDVMAFDDIYPEGHQSGVSLIMNGKTRNQRGYTSRSHSGTVATRTKTTEARDRHLIQQDCFGCAILLILHAIRVNR